MHSWGSLCKICLVKCIQLKDNTCIQSHVLGSVTECSFFLLEFICLLKLCARDCMLPFILSSTYFNQVTIVRPCFVFFCFVSVAAKEGSKRGLRNHETGQEAVVQGQGEDFSSFHIISRITLNCVLWYFPPFCSSNYPSFQASAVAIHFFLWT